MQCLSHRIKHELCDSRLALMLLITMRLSVTMLSMFCRSSARSWIKRALCA